MFEKKYYIKQDVKSQSKITIYIKYLFLFFIFLFTINIFANIFLYPTVAKGSIFVSPLAKEIIQRTALLINTYENSSKIENIIMSVLGSDKEYFGVVEPITLRSYVASTFPSGTPLGPLISLYRITPGSPAIGCVA